MVFLCTGITKQSYDTSHRVAANDRVIHQNYPVALNTFFNSGELDFHTVKSIVLSGRDKGSADILIFDKSDAVRDTGFHA